MDHNEYFDKIDVPRTRLVSIIGLISRADTMFFDVAQRQSILFFHINGRYYYAANNLLPRLAQGVRRRPTNKSCTNK